MAGPPEPSLSGMRPLPLGCCVGFDVISPVYEPTAEANGAGKTHALKKLKYIEIIRPRAHKPYGSVFGWG